jgi:hypothetical protein
VKVLIILYSGFYVFGDSQHITVEATAPQYHIVRPNKEGRGEGGLLLGCSQLVGLGVVSAVDLEALTEAGV